MKLPAKQKVDESLHFRKYQNHAIHEPYIVHIGIITPL